jgi:hypothetical protein
MTTTNGKRLKTTDRKTCWIDADLVRQARVIAGERGTTISEVLESACRATITREYANARTGRNGARKHGRNRT